MFHFLILLLSTCITLTTSTFTSDDGIAQYYGKIIPDHHTTLPNIDNQGNNIHYLINNLPITQDGLLNTFATLYHNNTDVMGENHDIILHIARPDDVMNPTATSRQVTYIQSIRLTNIESGIPISLLHYNIRLQTGDLIAVSVPNNAIFLRVGFNDMGTAVSYSATSVVPGSSDDSRIAIFTIVDPNTTPLLQLCAAFDVRPYGMPLPNDDMNYYPGRTYHFIKPAIQQEGCVTWFKVQTMDDGPITLTLAVARQHSDGKYYIVSNLEYTIQDLPSLVQYNITYGDFCVQVGDLVGYLDTAGDFLLAGSLPDNQLVDQCYVSLNGGSPSGALEEYSRNYYPAYQFGVATPHMGYGAANGDPQFAGFQGQSFQFHGLADEHFNLISTPTMQLNAHFVYLSSGLCNYNNTLCFQHPGTYLDVLGFIIPSIEGPQYVKIIAGPHDQGLRMWMGNETYMNETEVGDDITWMNYDGKKITITYTELGVVDIETPLIQIKIVNSDYFFNLQVGLMDEKLLHRGSSHHIITDKSLCTQNEQPGSHVMEHLLNQKYHSTYPLHGLIGQTWRNVRVCGKDWVGSVQDYLVSDLFDSDYAYNYHKQ